MDTLDLVSQGMFISFEGREIYQNFLQCSNGVKIGPFIPP